MHSRHIQSVYNRGFTVGRETEFHLEYSKDSWGLGASEQGSGDAKILSGNCTGRGYTELKGLLLKAN